MICSFSPCDRDAGAVSGLCRGHQQQLRKKGVLSPLAPRGQHGNHARGDRNSRWNDGMTVTADGYVKMKAPGHPSADIKGYAYAHIIVAEVHEGRILTPDEVVHHRNRNTRDNRPENLQIMTRSAHAVLHAELRRVARQGTAATPDSPHDRPQEASRSPSESPNSA